MAVYFSSTVGYYNNKQTKQHMNRFLVALVATAALVISVSELSVVSPDLKDAPVLENIYKAAGGR